MRFYASKACLAIALATVEIAARDIDWFAPTLRTTARRGYCGGERDEVDRGPWHDHWRRDCGCRYL